MRVKISAIFLAVFICLSNSNIAQELFSKVLYKDYNEVQSTSITASWDDAFIISGVLNNENLLIKVDSEANIVWAKTFADRNNFSNKVISLVDSNFLFMGSRINPDNGMNALCCIKFNTDGDTLWNSFVDMGRSFEAKSVVQTADQGFVIVGDIEYSSPVYSKIGIIKLDRWGSLIWGKEFQSGESRNYASDIVQNENDSTYFVSGNVYDTDNHQRKGYLMKLSPDGELLWSNYYHSYLGYNNGSDINGILMDNDSVVVALNAGPDCVMKLDLFGNVVWSKAYNGYGEFCFNEIFNNKIIKTSDSTYSLLSYSTVFNISTEGNFDKSVFFWMCVSDFVPDNNNGTMVVGNGPLLGVKKGIPNDPQIGIGNIDSLWNSYELCSYTSENPYYDTITISHENLDFSYEEIGVQVNLFYEFTTVELSNEMSCVAFIGSTEENTDNSSLSIYPNPSDGMVWVKSKNGLLKGSISIINVNGKEVMNLKTDGVETTINLEQLPSGLYQFKYSSDKETEMYKLILQ